jgi:hypothetical protein
MRNEQLIAGRTPESRAVTARVEVVMGLDLPAARRVRSARRDKLPRGDLLRGVAETASTLNGLAHTGPAGR